MTTPGIKVHGLQDLVRALKKVDEEIVRDFRDELEQAGELVRREAVRLFAPIDRFSSQGFKTVVRPTGRSSIVSIEQNLRRTTGTHPEWGAKQMTEALLPARENVMPEVEERLNHMVDRVLLPYGF